MSLIDIIFFACFVLFLLSGVALAFGQLIAQVLKREPDPRERRKASNQLQADEEIRPWQFLG